MKALRYKEMKINKYEFGHMTNMAAMPLYDKTFLHFQTPSPLKPLGRLKSNYMWSIHGKGERSLFAGSRSHVQNGRHAHIR